MPDYKQGKIYALRSYKNEMVYVGSTTQSLSQRLGGHKKKYKIWLNGKTNWCSSYEIIKQGDYYIELLEYADCKTRAELHKKEGEFIRKMECVNKLINGRDKKEYYQDNRRQILEKKKIYREKNKERINKYQKEYLKEYREKNKEQVIQKRKQYFEKNKERIIQRGKKYYEKNKEQISQRNKEKYRNKKLKKEWKKIFNEVLKNIK